jgi:hypothetical protein
MMFRGRGSGPRLRMGHLLLWIIGCAIGFAERRTIAAIDLPSYRDRVLVYGNSAVWAIALGSLFAGCSLMAYRRWRWGLAYPSRAGHWLLLRILAIHAASLGFGLYRVPSTAATAIVLMIHLAFLRGVRRLLPRHWVAVFLVAAINTAIRMVVFLAYSVGYWPSSIWRMSHISGASSLVGALATLWAIGRDRRAGVPADGLHRLGVGTALLLDASSVIFSLIVLLW